MAPLYHIHLSQFPVFLFSFAAGRVGAGSVAHPQMSANFLKPPQSNNQKDFELEWVVTAKSNLQEN